jgi:hypothetical protein
LQRFDRAQITSSWLALAGVLAGCAAVFSPGLVEAHLPAKAERYWPLVVSGIAFFRVLLVAGAGLALVTGWFAKRYTGIARQSRQDANESGKTRWHKWDFPIAGGFFVVSFLLRLPTLGSSLWMDELSTVVSVVKRGLPVIVAFSSDGNNHFMNSLLMYVSSKAFGEYEWALRLPAALLGASTVAALYLLTQRFLPRGAALTLASLAAVHFRYVEFSDSARGYAGAIFFGALACCLFLEMSRGFNRWTAGGYVAAVGLANAFLATTLYLPAAHALAALFWGALAARRNDRLRIFHWAAVVLTCAWAMLVSLMVNSITLPQLLEYAQRHSGLAHRKMGSDLAIGILYFISGCSHLAVAGIILLVAAVGLIKYRRTPFFLGSMLVPPAVYLLAFTVLGMRGSPRLFALLIFPTVLGLALFVYDESRQRAMARRCLAALVVVIFAADSVPEFIRFYSLSNPPLRQLAGRLRHQSVMLIGDQSDLNIYYFPEARWVPGGAGREETLAAVQTARPAPKYILMGIDCRRMLTKDEGRQVGVVDIQSLGYYPAERLIDWTYEEQAGDSERQPCFVLFTQPSAVALPGSRPERLRWRQPTVASPAALTDNESGLSCSTASSIPSSATACSTPASPLAWPSRAAPIPSACSTRFWIWRQIGICT